MALISRHYCTKGFKEGPNMSPYYAESHKPNEPRMKKIPVFLFPKLKIKFRAKKNDYSKTVMFLNIFDYGNKLSMVK